MFLEFFTNFLHSQFLVTPPTPTTDCTGKTVIVTGANVGLGKEAARHFARLNAEKVILACRSIEKGEAARDDIAQSTGRTGAIEVWSLDLQSYDSIRAFAKRVEGLKRVDTVVENAGIQSAKFVKVDGYESTIAVNVVSTFYLALLLLPKLQETSQKYNITPTLTIVASEMHFISNFSERKSSSIFDALNMETTQMIERYSTSKLLEVLTIRELAKRYPSSHLKVTLNCVTPGWCHSELGREIMNPIIGLIMRIFCRTTEAGGRTLVDAAVRGPESHGKYIQDCKVHTCSSLVEGPEGPELQRRFWEELAERLEGIQPGISDVLKA